MADKDKTISAVQDMVRGIVQDAFDKAGINKKAKVSKNDAKKVVDVINDTDKPAKNTNKSSDYTTSTSRINFGPKIPVERTWSTGYYGTGRGRGYTSGHW